MIALVTIEITNAALRRNACGKKPTEVCFNKYKDENGWFRITFWSLFATVIVSGIAFLYCMNLSEN